MVNLEVPHFSTAAPLSATRRTFQPPFTGFEGGEKMAEVFGFGFGHGGDSVILEMDRFGLASPNLEEAGQ